MFQGKLYHFHSLLEAFNWCQTVQSFITWWHDAILAGQGTSRRWWWGAAHCPGCLEAPLAKCSQFDAIVVERWLKYAETRTKAYKRNREALSSSGFLLKKSERRVENIWTYDPAACNVSELDSTHADQKVLYNNSTRSIPCPCKSHHTATHMRKRRQKCKKKVPEEMVVMLLNLKN